MLAVRSIFWSIPADAPRRKRALTVQAAGIDETPRLDEG
jgi:hypothetical protein